MKFMKILPFFYLLLVFINISKNAIAQDLKFLKKINQQWSFIENKGQLADETGKPLSDIKYYGKDNDVNIYCRNRYISFVFSKRRSIETNNTHLLNKNKPKAVLVDFTRFEMHFVGCNFETIITPSEQQEDYLNFYLAHTPEEGIKEVKQFNKLTYHNIYNNIDMILYVREKGFKYEFIINPGGNPNDIKIKWNGTSPELMHNGEIIYKNQIGFMTETPPKTFSDNNLIDSRFEFDKQGNLHFMLGNYPLNRKLVIDPSLNWSSYYGGSTNESVKSICIDKNGNLFFGGNTASTSGIATSGSYQSSLAGASDIYFVKMNSSGVRIWGTYFGGTDDDEFGNIGLDTAENIFISGRTKSSGLATSGSYQSSIAGGADCLFAKFSKTGNRVWSTYFGGSGFDGGNKLSTNIFGDVYFTGYTQSSSGVATTGAFQTTFGGKDDALIAKFDKNGKIYWATYFGGSGYEGETSIVADDSTKIYFTGYTSSTSGISSSSAFQTSLAGNDDAMFGCFDKNGNRIWSSYFGGSNRDWGSAITLDKNGSLLIVGLTESSSGISTSGAHQSTFGGSNDGFIAKFNSSGQRQWATYYGGNSTDWAIATTSGKSGEFYIAGMTKSTSGIATSGSYQSTHGGSGVYEDAFISQFSNNGKLLKASYFGGTEFDNASGIAGSDKMVVLSGSTASTSKIATSGAYQTTNGGKQDGYIASFKFCPSTDTTITAEACDSFLLNNIIYRKSGSYTQTKTNANKCDSIITLKLKILNNGSTIIKSVCDSFTLNNTTYYETGTYTQKFKNKLGCDSTVTLKLAVKKSSDTVIVVSSCYSYLLNQNTYDSSGTYVQILSNYKGCDSIITLHLTIYDDSDTLISATACEGYSLNGYYYNASGTYKQKMPSSTGCDSIISLNLTINNKTSSNYFATACDSININKKTYLNSGKYVQTLINTKSCDSLLTLDLKILKSSSAEIIHSGCNSFFLNDSTYKTSGIYIQIRKNMIGCDSIIKLNLTVFDSVDASFNTIINQNKVTFKPTDLNAKSYFWDFGNAVTSTQKVPIHTYLSKGNYKVSLKTFSQENCQGQHDTTISISEIGSLKPLNKSQIQVYPNPSNGEIYIDGLTEIAKIKIMDVKGIIIPVNYQVNKKSIKIEFLKKGIYFININDKNIIINKKIIVFD